MKRYFLFVLLLYLAKGILAEDGHRILVNGRTWNYQSIYFTGSDPDTVYHSITIEGPVEFDGKQCYKEKYNTAKYYYEDGSKVYTYVLDGTNGYVWREAFNFGLNPGDDDVDMGDGLIVYGVRSVDFIRVNGEDYRRLNYSNDVLVEGIGSSRSGIRPRWDTMIGTLMEKHVLSVYDGGVCIFTKEDFTKPAYATAIRTARNNSVNAPSFFDLQGRRLSGKPAKGVYIENGRKRVVK